MFLTREILPRRFHIVEDYKISQEQVDFLRNSSSNNRILISLLAFTNLNLGTRRSVNLDGMQRSPHMFHVCASLLHNASPLQGWLCRPSPVFPGPCVTLWEIPRSLAYENKAKVHGYVNVSGLVVPLKISSILFQETRADSKQCFREEEKQRTGNMPSC